MPRGGGRRQPLALRVIEMLQDENPPSRDQGRDRPGRFRTPDGGKAAAEDLTGPDGSVVVRKGEARDGGSYEQRMSRIAVWNSVMDQHNYLVRRWNEFLLA